MRKGKFISMLKQLTLDEVVEFGKFLKQYHKKDKTALRIFQYVCVYAPDFGHDNLSLDRTYQEIYKARLPESPLETRNKLVKKLLNKLSELSHWLEDFLWYQKINARSLERDLIWSTILMERGMFIELPKHRLSLNQKLKESLPMDSTGYLKQMMVSYFTNFQFSEAVQGAEANFLSDFIKDLDNFYAVTRLKLACEIETLKLVKPEASSETEPDFPLSSLMALLPADQIQSNPLIAIYAELFILITDKSKKSYEKVEALLKENLKSINPKEQYIILVFLQNYAAIQIRFGNTDYIRIAHDLNVFGISQGFFTKDGLITPNHYTNIINTACKAGALDWAGDFARDYSLCLDPNIRENVTKLGNAIVLFEKGDYSGILSSLADQSFSDFHCEIRSRSLLLRSKWELRDRIHDRDTDHILSYCLAFEQYLINRAKKSQSEIVTASLNFVRIFKKIIIGRKDKAEIITEIQALELLYFRKWLLKQAEL